MERKRPTAAEYEIEEHRYEGQAGERNLYANINGGWNQGRERIHTETSVAIAQIAVTKPVLMANKTCSVREQDEDGNMPLT
jgi:hypothetical protein